MITALPRRKFLLRSASVTLGPLLVPARVLRGMSAPSGQIRLGHIGTGNQGRNLLTNFLGVTGALSVAVADPFQTRRELAAQMIAKGQGHQPKLHNDYRRLLEDPDIQAVVIATPDHWHVPIAMAAMEAGKDVYVEKPLSHSIAANRALSAAAAQHQRIFQYGTQQRSQEIIRRGLELVLNGFIGELRRLDIWCPRGASGGSKEEIPVPAGLDYNLYLGPAPQQPCSRDRVTNQGSWYCADYSNGFLGGWGAHPLDLALWGQDFDQAGPFVLSAQGEIPTPNGLFNTVTSWDARLEFANGVQARFMSDDIAQAAVTPYLGKHWAGDGTTFFGTEGWVSVGRSLHAASKESLFRETLKSDARRLPAHNNFYQSFVDSVRARRTSMAPLSDAMRSDAISQIADIAIRKRQKITWDPLGYRILSPPELREQEVKPARNWEQS